MTRESLHHSCSTTSYDGTILATLFITRCANEGQGLSSPIKFVAAVGGDFPSALTLVAISFCVYLVLN